MFHDNPAYVFLRCQQGSGRIMFWGGIIGNSMIGPLKVPNNLTIKTIHLGYLI